MKRFISILLAAMMVLSAMTACGASQPAAPQSTETTAPAGGEAAPETTEAVEAAFQWEKHVVAVAVISYNAELVVLKDYLENYIADRFNIEFLFSDALGSDVGEIVNFVENAYTSGAEAIIDCACTSPSDVLVVAERCNELGLWYTTWNASAAVAEDLEYFVGAATQDIQAQGVLIKQILKELLNDGQPHNFILHTGSAQYGNASQTTLSIATLEALQEIYGLTYQDDIANIVKTNTMLYLDTGREDVKIAITVATQNTDEFNEIAKKGEYDVAIFTQPNYLNFESIISDIEKALGMDIKVISSTAIAETTANSFNTLDSNGSPSLDAAICSHNGKYGVMVALVLNALYGYVDDVKVDGKGYVYECPNWPIMNAEEYSKASVLGTSLESPIFGEEDIVQMFKGTNPELSSDMLKQYAASCGFQDTLTRKGMN